jgi:hypothetical protein
VGLVRGQTDRLGKVASDLLSQFYVVHGFSSLSREFSDLKR